MENVNEAATNVKEAVEEVDISWNSLVFIILFLPTKFLFLF